MKVLAISTDSIYSHKVFSEMSPSMKNVTYPLLSDRNHDISQKYGVLRKDKGTARRATIIINPEGVVEAKHIYPAEVGRNSSEIVRLIEALQFHRTSQLGAPANWTPGKPGIERDISKAGTI